MPTHRRSLVAGAALGLLGQVATVAKTQATGQPSIIGSWKVAGPDQQALYSFIPGGILIATDDAGRTWHGAWAETPDAEHGVLYDIRTFTAEGQGEGISGLLSAPPGADEIEGDMPGVMFTRLTAE